MITIQLPQCSLRWVQNASLVNRVDGAHPIEKT